MQHHIFKSFQIIQCTEMRSRCGQCGGANPQRSRGKKNQNHDLYMRPSGLGSMLWAACGSFSKCFKAEGTPHKCKKEYSSILARGEISEYLHTGHVISKHSNRVWFQRIYDFLFIQLMIQLSTMKSFSLKFTAACNRFEHRITTSEIFQPQPQEILQPGLPQRAGIHILEPICGCWSGLWQWWHADP